jgi:hypothetical protein
VRLKKATDKDTADYVLFEGYAPHGIALLIETATTIIIELLPMLEVILISATGH